jgi:hypothetical protein
MARLTRLALVPLTLVAAAAPAVAQADAVMAGGGPQSAALLGSVGNVKLYPFAGSQLDPLSNAVNATVAGVPLNSTGVTQVFSDGLPVRDLPGYSDVMSASDSAQAVGDAAMAADADGTPAGAAH